MILMMKLLKCTWITTRLEFNSKPRNQNLHVLKQENFDDLLWKNFAFLSHFKSSMV